MLQERPSSNPSLEHLGGQAHIPLPTLQTGGLNSLLPTKETSVPKPTPNRYWRILNDPRFSPPIANPEPLIVSAEVFLSLTHRVHTLVGLMQTIVPHTPQLMQTLASQQPGVPRQAPHQGASQSPPIRREQPDNRDRAVPN
ncbi:hypothetical protein B296_00045487 [Ensete ventricosum]|uniref:Uncharacterized protein n=1 Tax=Ensete ventricosum TaxID=4639 RepID=A0A426XJD7_ENSVE|nr:hypothetical protein B296_00045487 [Ensete ventricosum]